MWVESQAPPARSFLVLRIVLIIGSASDWLRRPHSWQSQQFYIVFVQGLPATENWDLSQPRSSHSSQWRELGDKMTKDEDDKKFTWQSLILTKAAHCADTERCPEKNRESWLWERCDERGERMVCGVWVLEHWNIIERCWGQTRPYGSSWFPCGHKTFPLNFGLKYDSARSRKLLASLNLFVFLLLLP